MYLILFLFILGENPPLGSFPNVVTKLSILLDPAHVTLRVKLCMCVYIYIYTKFMSIVPRVCLAKVPFLALFFWPGTNIERGVAL